ncbi:MAG TPA: EMC3/TMCO1 family protein [Candidatus Lokiarchaeia archaeon]|nr:EMC3/TMCO1 family protein [Candidatus Lokiarchaeia archaeon]
MKNQPKKKKKYRIKKEKPFNIKNFLLIILGFSILLAMIIVFSAINSIPGGPLFKSAIQKPPNSMIFILLISLTINISSTMLGKALIDTGEMQRKMKIIKDHNKEKKDVEKLKDVDFKQYQKRMIKVKRMEASVKKMTQNISMQRMKPSCVTFLPMIILFFFIQGMFNIPTIVAFGNGFWFNVIPGGSVGIAKLVMNPYPELSFLSSYLFPGPDVVYWGSRGFISFTAFYFLASFSVGVIVQRLSGLGTSGMGGFGDMGNLTGMSRLK